MKDEEKQIEKKIAEIRQHPLCFDFRVYPYKFVLIYQAGYSVDMTRGIFSLTPKTRILEYMLAKLDELSKEKGKPVDDPVTG